MDITGRNAVTIGYTRDGTDHEVIAFPIWAVILAIFLAGALIGLVLGHYAWL
jgi:hypothetical protein